MNRLRLRCANVTGLNIYDSLLCEELIWRHSTDNWFLFNTGPVEPTIVLGLSGKIPALVNMPNASRDKVPLIRRFTGGGTVIVDPDTVFSTFVLNASDVGTLPYPRDIMNWSEKLYKPVFEKLCPEAPFALRDNDYVMGHLKIGGNAQAITRGRIVHHTSFLWNYQRKNMEYLLMPEKKPEYRGTREHDDFLGRIEDHIPLKYIPQFNTEIAHQLQQLCSRPNGEESLQEEVEVDFMTKDSFLDYVDDIRDGRSWNSLTRTVYERIPF